MMTASESAEAFLIVIKRVGKWMLLLIVGVAILVFGSLGWLEFNDYLEKRPFKATKYADVSLGSSYDEVIYILGPPPHFLSPKASIKYSNLASSDDPVVETENSTEKSNYSESSEWLYTENLKRIDIALDAPKGRVKSIACYSESAYFCPGIYGIHDGSSEDDVLSHLGKPASEVIDGTAKIIRYPQYNLTLYLTKRQVYMIKISKNASF